MRLELIDRIKCPQCIKDKKSLKRKYNITGDYNDQKIFDGFITCENHHTFHIRDELFKLDKVSLNTENLYSKISLDYNKDQWYQANNLVKQDILQVYPIFDEIFDSISEDNDVVVISGEFVPFIKRLKSKNFEFVIIDTNEGKLRAAMEQCVLSGIYDKVDFVQTEVVEFIDDIQAHYIALFVDFKRSDINYSQFSINDEPSNYPIGSKFIHVHTNQT
jgi:hypothetical protein